MARVQMPANELDHNYRVETSIAELLRRGETAEISMASIEKYAMLEDVDHGEEMTASHSLSRLDQIAAALHEYEIDDADYRIVGDDVQFWRRQKPR